MRRVLVATSDLLFYSQVRGVAQPLGWSVEPLRDQRLPPDGVEGDAIIVDATRDLEAAWRIVDASRAACPWFLLVCHQHLHPEVGEEALRRGATEAVRRGLVLSRLHTRLGQAPTALGDAPQGAGRQ